jgi:hypothetical protein
MGFDGRMLYTSSEIATYSHGVAQHSPAVRVAIATVFDMHPVKERQGAAQPDPCTITRRDGGRCGVFRQFTWLEVGSVQVA